MKRKCPQEDRQGERCAGTSPRESKQLSFSGLPARQWGVLESSTENNRGRQADESPDPNSGRECGKGGNKEACGYFLGNNLLTLKLYSKIP